MSRTTKPLTDTQIKNEKSSPKDAESGLYKDHKLYDGNNLILLIKKAIELSEKQLDGSYKITLHQGSKLWHFKYTFQGKENTLSLGKHPTVSLKEAREKSQQLRVYLSKGIDPAQIKKQEKESKSKRDSESPSSLKNVFNDFLIFKELEQTLGDKQLRIYRSRMENYIFPKLGDKTMSSISKEEIIACIKNVPNIHLKKGHKAVDNKADTARRLFGICQQLWQWAAMNSRTEENITRLIEINLIVAKSKYTRHYSKITNEKDLGELLRAIDNYSGDGILVRNALKLLSILSLRSENLVTLRWEMINYDNMTLTIPRKEMKNKDPNLPDFTLPLPTQAIIILQDIQKITGFGKWVFHGFKDMTKHMNAETCNKALRSLGFTDEVSGKKQTSHSFRGTFRSLAETHFMEHKASFETREHVLDHHEQDKYVRAYTHRADYTEQMRPLLQWWADFLDKTRDSAK